MSHTEDSVGFKREFERWRVAITSLVPTTTGRSSPLRCDEQNKWEDGKIMQPKEGEAVPEKTEADLKREAKECKRCERWRDDLTKESESRVRFPTTFSAPMASGRGGA